MFREDWLHGDDIISIIHFNNSKSGIVNLISAIKYFQNSGLDDEYFTF